MHPHVCPQRTLFLPSPRLSCRPVRWYHWLDPFWNLTGRRDRYKVSSTDLAYAATLRALSEAIVENRAGRPSHDSVFCFGDLSFYCAPLAPPHFLFWIRDANAVTLTLQTTQRTSRTDAGRESHTIFSQCFDGSETDCCSMRFWFLAGFIDVVATSLSCDPQFTVDATVRAYVVMCLDGWQKFDCCCSFLAFFYQ